MLAFALALLSATGAIVLGSHLRQPLRLVFVSIIAVALPGAIEVASLLPDNFGNADGFVNVALTPLVLTPYLGMLLYPLIIAAVVVDDFGRRRLRTTSSTESDPHLTEIRRRATFGIVRFIIATLIIVSCVALIGWTATAVFGSSPAEHSLLYSQPNGVIAACSAVIVFAVPLSVGYLAKLELPATVIDLGDRTASPGFIDAHVHLTMDASNLQMQTLGSTATKALTGLSIARSYLDHGFTTVRDLGSMDSAAPRRHRCEETADGTDADEGDGECAAHEPGDDGHATTL